MSDEALARRLNQILASLGSTKRILTHLDSKVTDQQDRLGGVESQLEIFEAAIEMNLWVTFKLIQDGVFSATNVPEDFDDLKEKVVEYQQSYLYHTAICNGFAALGSDTYGDDEPDDDASDGA